MEAANPEALYSFLAALNCFAKVAILESRGLVLSFLSFITFLFILAFPGEKEMPRSLPKGAGWKTTPCFLRALEMLRARELLEAVTRLLGDCLRPNLLEAL